MNSFSLFAHHVLLILL